VVASVCDVAVPERLAGDGAGAASGAGDTRQQLEGRSRRAETSHIFHMYVEMAHWVGSTIPPFPLPKLTALDAEANRLICALRL
jgi:hypothetical protein